MKNLQNFAAFSEYMNFNIKVHGLTSVNEVPCSIYAYIQTSQQTFGPSCFDRALAILIVYSLGLDQPRNTRTASLWLLQENILNFHMVGHFLNSLHFLKSSISTLANSLRRVNGTVSITSMPRSPKCVQI